MKSTFLCLAAIWILGSSLWAREPTPQDYTVWSAVMCGGRTGDLYVWYRVEPTSLFARGFDGHALEHFPDATFVERAWSEEAAPLDPGAFALDDPIKILRTKDLKRILGKTPKATWVLSPALIPGTDAIFRLSWPAYSQDGRVAYVLAGNFNEWQGSLVIYRLNKDEAGDWGVERSVSKCLSSWGPGWPPGGERRLFIED